MNSPYTYLLLFREFGETCVVCRDPDRLAAFVTAFRPPTRRDTVFVWQIAVAADARGRGLGSSTLLALLERVADHGVRYLEATVTPSNEASAALFRGVARDLGVACDVRVLFPAALFPRDERASDELHEPEVLFRIGPFERGQLEAAIDNLATRRSS